MIVFRGKDGIYAAIDPPVRRVHAERLRALSGHLRRLAESSRGLPAVAEGFDGCANDAAALLLALAEEFAKLACGGQ